MVTLECMLHKWTCPDPALLYPDGGRGCHKCVAFVCRSLQLETFPHPHIAFPPGVPPSRSGPADARKRAWFRLVVFLFFCFFLSAKVDNEEGLQKPSLCMTAILLKGWAVGFCFLFSSLLEITPICDSPSGWSMCSTRSKRFPLCRGGEGRLLGFSAP